MFEAYSYWTIACLVLGGLIIIPTIMGFFAGNKFEVDGKTVLLTGASEGMGKAVAKELASKGASIVIVARNVGKLEEALEEIKASAKDPSAQRFQYISTDLSEPSAALLVIAEAIAWNKGNSPDIVWCLAGSSYPAFWIDTPVSKLRSQMDVNYWAATEMAHAILNEWLSPSALAERMVGSPPKHLVFTSSVLAFYSTVGYGAYSPTKAALRSLGDTLAQELQIYGGGEAAKVHVVCPGTIATAGFERENLTKPEITKQLEDADPIGSPEEVAVSAIKRLENGEYLIVCNWLGSLMRSQSWSGMRRGNWLLETVMTWFTSLLWIFLQRDLDGKVRKYGIKNGHPGTYPKKQ
ncbi:hypothetical protein BJ875DRAFT_475713 [Amylocarpus encephaloides]|uniref:3-dehydrosphinganine reductase n=1 Tax=Amylocarpus encephaloides TaxID=45428 RepID=A0A9P7Y843_9HELO|nr:hypothetical protein BJ875DRAFT_475713 [Amylocarpus encephaloides]